jgi:hypothetical protein
MLLPIFSSNYFKATTSSTAWRKPTDGKCGFELGVFRIRGAHTQRIHNARMTLARNEEEFLILVRNKEKSKDFDSLCAHERTKP